MSEPSAAGSKSPAACLTFDFDAVSLWLRTFGLSTPSPLSRGEFGPRVGMPRILDLLRDEGVKATFFIPGHTIESWPDICRRIAAEGHEIGHHGYLHESPLELDRDQERQVLERGLEVMDRVLGVRPRGYRSPGWDLSPNSLDLLLELGFEYDSSMMAQDFEPYRPRRGDIAHLDRAYEFGEEVDLVEFPVSWSLDDYPYLEHNHNPPNVGLTLPETTLKMWTGDFDYMRRKVPNGVFGLTCHPQVIGRGSRMTILEGLIAHMKECGARFQSVGDAVAGWRGANPV